MFTKWKQRLFRDPVGDVEDGDAINRRTRQRNRRLTLAFLVLLALGGVGLYQLARPPRAQTAKVPTPVEFGAIIEPDFTEKDNQSALSMQQQTLAKLQEAVQTLTKQLSTLQATTQVQWDELKTDTAQTIEQQVRQSTEAERTELRARLDALEHKQEPGTPDPWLPWSPTGDAPSLGPLPPGTPRPPVPGAAQSPSLRAPFGDDAFDSHDFVWHEKTDKAADRRTPDNYVPTGTFVTAVVTGGADANAGVLGQGDTAPMVFQTVNAGILPNGQPSTLGNCTLTASVYGDVSASRGVVRTQRLSCVRPSGDILDLPVKGTAFNFGRNGIRGTTILKNGKIIEMAGISGLLTGLGETGKALSQTTSTSALGTTQTLKSQDAALNLLGNASTSVGAKLANYYIKLAEQYHPIVEINPGALVNIVFLEGFPLDPLKAQDYERAQQAQAKTQTQSNALLDVITNGPRLARPVNPLAHELAQQGIASPFAAPTQETP